MKLPDTNPRANAGRAYQLKRHILWGYQDIYGKLCLQKAPSMEAKYYAISLHYVKCIFGLLPIYRPNLNDTYTVSFGQYFITFLKILPGF